MWVIFLLAALSVAIVALIFIYIAHRVIMRMEKERKNNNQNNNKEGETNNG